MNLFKMLMALCFLTLVGHAARASFIHEWTFVELAAKAEVLATAQVESVETLSRDDSSPKDYPQLRRRAVVRVVRIWAAPGQQAPEIGQTIPLEFRSFDRANIRVYINTMPDELPDVAVGQIWVFHCNATPRAPRKRARGTLSRDGAFIC